jgi:hypothetical protein
LLSSHAEAFLGRYRLYFLGKKGDFQNVEDFSAESDDQALLIAESLNDAVSDVYPGYELWQGARRIFRHPASAVHAVPASPAVIAIDIQAEVLRCEETLRTSGAAFARSRKLLEKIRAAREAAGDAK